jgi:PIN domain nuclease of toxin-antitoxin system
VDSSAVVAFAMGEPGADMVSDVMASAAIPAPNWVEVLDVVQRRAGNEARTVARTLKALGLLVEPVAEDDAEVAASLILQNPGLSLGDRFCLAVAERFERPVYTADPAWATVTTNARVVVIG